MSIRFTQREGTNPSLWEWVYEVQILKKEVRFQFSWLKLHNFKNPRRSDWLDCKEGGGDVTSFAPPAKAAWKTSIIMYHTIMIIIGTHWLKAADLDPNIYTQTDIQINLGRRWCYVHLGAIKNDISRRDKSCEAYKSSYYVVIVPIHKAGFFEEGQISMK